MEPKRIAYFRPSTTIPANVSFLEALGSAFPEYSIETIDLASLLGRHRSLRFANYLHSIAEFGPKAVPSRAGRVYRGRTRYFFAAVNRLLRQTVESSDFSFSVQIQSLFDGHCGIPHFVYTDHTHVANLDYEDAEHGKFVPEWLPLERLIYHRARMVFARSSNIASTLLDHYELPADRVACVYAGPNAAQPLGAVDTAKYATKNILFVGIDWERKGGPTLLRAFEKVLAAHPDAELTIVGCAPDVTLPNCRVLGAVPLADIPAFYEQCSIFCMPTQLEPFGIVFVEALTHALPIVATRVGAIPDMVVDGQNGYLVEPGDADALAANLGLLLDDAALRERFGAAGRELAAERYNWEQVGKRLREHIGRSLRAAGA